MRTRSMDTRRVNTVYPPPPRVLSVVAGSEVRAAPNDGGSIIDSAKAYNVALANGARRTDRRADVKRDRIRVQPPVIKM